jgi:transposase
VNCTPKVRQKLLEVQFFMRKYSDEFKIKAVQMVLDGNAIKYVCKILAIPDSRPLRDWLAGFNQLLHKTVHIPRILNKKSLSTAGSMG